MNTERKPVDVLSVIDATLAQVPHNLAEKRDNLREARAAVAELIEEVEATLDLLETQGYAPMHAKLLRAALARCGGA